MNKVFEELLISEKENHEKHLTWTVEQKQNCRKKGYDESYWEMAEEREKGILEVLDKVIRWFNE